MAGGSAVGRVTAAGRWLILVSDHSLFQAFDFYRDPTDGRLRFAAPSLSAARRAEADPEPLESSTVSMIDRELDDLGGVVRDVLADYLERTDQASDIAWPEDPYGSREG